MAAQQLATRSKKASDFKRTRKRKSVSNLNNKFIIKYRGSLFPKERLQLRTRIALQQTLACGLKLWDFHVFITQNLCSSKCWAVEPKEWSLDQEKEEHKVIGKQ